jgi:hypothetical protein
LYGLMASMTRSTVALRAKKNTAALPGSNVSPISRIRLSSTPISVKRPVMAPVPAPTPAPTAAPANGLRNSNPIKVPHNAPVTAPDPAIIAVRFTD